MNDILPEPSGRTAPKGTGDGLNKYRGVEGESLALACAAQGFPAPISRYTQFRIASLFFFFLLFGRLVLLRRARVLFSKRSILTLYPVSGGGTVKKSEKNRTRLTETNKRDKLKRKERKQRQIENAVEHGR